MQFPKRQHRKSVLAAALDTQPVLATALGPLAHLSRSSRRLRGPNLTFGKVQLGKLHNIWEIATLEIVAWEVALGKLPLGKYLTPFNIPKMHW